MKKFIFFLLFLSFLLSAEASVCKIGILPFENFCKNGDKKLGKSIASSISSRMAFVKSLQVVERIALEKIFEEIARGKTGIFDEATVAKVGKQSGADYILIGDVQGNEKEVLVSARVVSVEKGIVITGRVVKGPWKDLFSLEDKLTIQILDGLGIKLTDIEEEEIFNSKKNTAKDWFLKGVNSSDSDIALEYYKKAISIKPDYSDAYCNMGIIYSKKGDTKKGEEYYKKAIEFNPKNTVSMYNLGILYENMKEYSLALKYYNKIIDIQENYNVNLHIGIIYRLEGKLDDAEKELLSISDNLHDNFDLYYNLGLVLYEKGYLEASLFRFTEALKIKKDNPELFYYTGQVYYKMKNYTQAEKNYLKSLSLNPENKNTIIALGELYICLARYNDAIKQFKSLDKTENLIISHGLGQSYLGLKEYDKSIENFNNFLAIKPDDSEVLFLLARAYDLKGNKEKAFEKYTRVMELNPSHKEAENAICRIEFRSYLFFLMKIFIALIIFLGIIALLIIKVLRSSNNEKIYIK